MKTIHPQIQALMKALQESPLQLSTGPQSADFAKHFYRYVRIDFPEQSIDFPVEDDFEDVKQNKPLVLFHLLLAECEYFEDTADYSEWAKEGGHDTQSPTIKRIYCELQEKVPLVRQWFGKHLKAIPAFDIEMNTGLAQALRQADPHR